VSAADRPIRVGVVGVGHLGRHHARIYAQLPGVQLVAVVDHDAARAVEVAAACGCTVLPCVDDLALQVDAASVAVPTVSHAEVAATLLAAGVDVLVEKPLAPTLAAAEEMVELAERHGRRLMVGHSERFNPAVLALVERVRDPRFFEIHRLAAFSARSNDIDVVLDLMIHDLDLVLHLARSDAVSVEAVGVAAVTDKVDIANARIRFASGCVANLTASRISTEPVRRVRVFQPHAYLACDTQRRVLECYRLSAEPGGSPSIGHEVVPVSDAEPLALEIGAFVEAVRARVPPPIDGQQAVRVLHLAERVRRSIASG